MPSVAILGASTDPSKFGNRAVRAFAARGYDVYPVNPREKKIEGYTCYASVRDIPVSRLDMVSVYLPPAVGLQVIAELAEKEIGEVWLNPGADSPALIEKAEKLGLTVIAACSIVGIGESPGDY